MELRLFGKRLAINFKNAVDRGLPGLSDDAAWASYLAGRGYNVSTSTALKVAVVIRCADVVAKTMASLGCHLYKTGSDGSKVRDVNNPLYKLLRMLPNPETTAYEFWHMYVFSLMLTNGAYAKIVRDSNGFVRELWNIPSRAVSLRRNAVTRERYLEVHHLDGSTETLYDGDFMYTPGLRFQDGDNPHDFINIAADVLGLTMDLNGYAKDYFERGSNPGGFIEYDGRINEDKFAAFRKEWEKAYSGVMNQHKWAILEGGFKLTKLDTNPEQAQALESRKFQVIEVCRIMGIPPHKAYDLDKASYASVEQENIGYVQETIDPMDERITQTIYKDLLTPTEQRRHYARFNVNKLLKGDIAARTTYYHNARQDGWMNANEIRDLEEMNSIPAEDGGNIYAINGNMIPITSIPLNLPKGAQKAGNNNG